MSKSSILSISLLALLSSLSVLAGAAPDVLVLSNGDQLKGEIKKLSKEVIVFSTDYSDEDFKIKWEKVVRIESDREFLVENFAGARVTGSIQPDPRDTKATTVGSENIALADMASIQPFERNFWSRLDWGFDLGYSMTKANSVKQLTAGT